MEGSTSSKATPLHVEKLAGLLGATGPISRRLASFETRPQQQEMLKTIATAYNSEGIALIEAGTGTGKSMAYLLPALVWALQNKSCSLISTNTIALQEQLLHKDIPFLIKALEIDCKVVLVKGMSNYLCLRKLDECRGELPLLGEESAAELHRLEAWSSTTEEGSRSSLPFHPTAQGWERVSADSQACSRDQCPHYKRCFFFKARREAGEAQLLIANHHLLFTDLAHRAENNNYKNSAILPPYRHLVIDEAHNLEEIATHHLAERTSVLEIHQLLTQLVTPTNSQSRGKLPTLKATIEAVFKKHTPDDAQKLLQTLDIDLIAEIGRFSTLLFETFGALHAFTIAHQSVMIEEMNNCTLRLLPTLIETVQWRQEVVVRANDLLTSAKSFCQTLLSLDKRILEIESEKLTEKTKSLRLDISAIGTRLQKACGIIAKFTLSPLAPDFVRWIELHKLKISYNIHIVEAALDVAPLLAEQLFNPFSSIILCSATLATDRQFSFCRQRLGLTPELLPDRSVTEHIFDSPFDFAKQSLLVIPQGLPLPSHHDFLDAAIVAVEEAVHASRGNAFVLFTSYSMLTACYQRLESRLQHARYHPCKQGDAPRHTLLKMFKEKDRSVLFGTDTFWEGVDVAGEALRCVIIAKLPFRVPTEPIIEARTAAITARGGNPFVELSLPHAIVKFKQGFGRLIRHQKDRGCVVCLDHRLVSKSYGNAFLNSLPACSIATIPVESLKTTMEQFYRTTHYLTKS